MTLNDLQRDCLRTAVYPNIGDNLPYAVLGLCGEAGEIANKAKKVTRDHGGVLCIDTATEMAKELGDVLWYVSATAHELGFSLETVAEMMLEKLSNRSRHGTLRGNGDNR